jgi:chromosome partitioning protein
LGIDQIADGQGKWGGRAMPDWALQLVGQLFQFVVLPAMVPVAAILLLPVWRRIVAYRLIGEARKAVARNVEGGITTEGPGFWLKGPINKLPNYDAAMRSSIPILMIGTLKGGVGKTTLSANLAAHFAMRWRNSVGQKLRVLLIDLDFQGSMSTMTLADAGGNDLICRANRLVSGELNAGRLVLVAQPITATGMFAPLSISTIPAGYDLAQAENRTMIEWLLPASDWSLVGWLLGVFRLASRDDGKPKTDLRYRLAEALLDRNVQSEYDLVIIDAPPRLTTSHVQAMCASTHVLIPSIIDRLSGDAVAKYLSQIAALKNGRNGSAAHAICPHLMPLGVVCTMVQPPPKNHEGVLNELEQTLARAPLNAQILRDAPIRIRRRSEYADCAGERIAYAAETLSLAYEQLRQEVDALGLVLANGSPQTPGLGARARGWTVQEPRPTGWPN